MKQFQANHGLLIQNEQLNVHEHSTCYRAHCPQAACRSGHWCALPEGAIASGSSDQEAFAGAALAINLHEDRIRNARRRPMIYGRLDIADNVLIHASPWRVRADAGIFIVL